MEKTKEQILLSKLRQAARKTRPHRGHGGPQPRPMPFGEHRGPQPRQMPFEEHRGPQPRPMPFDGRGPGPQRPHGPGMLPRELLLVTVLQLAGDQGVRQKDLAQELGINASSLSEQIDRLEQQCYLERRANPEDKRSTLIVLTEKGKARAWELQDERQAAAAGFCAGLSEEEKDQLIALLDKLLQSGEAGPKQQA